MAKRWPARYGPLLGVVMGPLCNKSKRERESMALRLKRLTSIVVLVSALLGGGAVLTSGAATPSPHAAVAASPASPDSAPVINPAGDYLWSDVGKCPAVGAKPTRNPASQNAIAV